METTPNMISFVAIALYYAFLGSSTMLGSIYLSKLFLTPKIEQIFFAGLLMMISGVYLVFTAYFGNNEAWGLETAAVIVFSVFAVVGIRIPAALIIGFVLHGIWDIFHEFDAHVTSLPWDFTSIPLAYGFFCLAYDVLAPVYFWTRRKEWEAAWSKTAAAAP